MCAGMVWDTWEPEYGRRQTGPDRNSLHRHEYKVNGRSVPTRRHHDIIMPLLSTNLHSTNIRNAIALCGRISSSLVQKTNNK